MSSDSESAPTVDVSDDSRVGTFSLGRIRRVDRARAFALVGLFALTASYASVLWEITDVVGGGTEFVAVVAGSLALAVVVGRFVGIRIALGLTSVLLVLGLVGYLGALPQSQVQLLTPERAVSDTVALLTGLSILRLVGAGVWAVAIVPGPVFLSWYLAVRRRYVAAAAAGSVALALVVLTGDATGLTTLLGVLGATVTVAAATVERHGTGFRQADVLTALLAAMIVVSATASVLPGAAGSPVLPDRDSPTVEASLVDAGDDVDIVGSIRLSPEVRFTVESPRGEYWQTGAYDRYTGDGWVRTGNTRPYDGRLQGPPGPSSELEQTVTAESAVSILPAAWKPIAVDGEVAAETTVTPQGTIRPETTLLAGDQYTVTSRVPNATTEQLRTAGTGYPDHVTDSYLQLPESTTERVRDRSEAVAGDAETPYDKAVAIEEHLESNREYSLDVPAPSGDVADAFLFEMDAGYCTYYATTMVVMLRSQGVPARFATGYTSGEALENDSYVVRGLNSHAWVEVYFPDVGWVRFDPTPSGPRESAENARIADARENGAADGDLSESNETPVPSDSGTQNTTPETDGQSTPGGITTADSANTTDSPAGGPNAGAPTPGPSGDGSSPLPELPPRRTIIVALVALVGVGAGARHSSVTTRAIRLLSIQFQRRTDPETDVARAHRRLSVLLAQGYRPREPGETPRAYVDSLPMEDSRAEANARRVVELYERVRYGDGVDATDAAEAVETVDRLVRDSTPVRRWLR
ncbi:transglutaminaseTgpA domain-containing protein [Halobellus captivus]|uniref:transglutaminaseTgpA domain-containing protein n=1 Tax=Halobellus captivus TaxID=2592614 RepID=UPI0011A9EFCA|nr:transglutaminaseTgpA domain-containing protein [Halobellus captivus]